MFGGTKVNFETLARKKDNILKVFVSTKDQLANLIAEQTAYEQNIQKEIDSLKAEKASVVSSKEEAVRIHDKINDFLK